MTRHRSASPGKFNFKACSIWIEVVWGNNKSKNTSDWYWTLFLDCPFVRDASDNVPLLASSVSSSNMIHSDNESNTIDRVGK